MTKKDKKRIVREIGRFFVTLLLVAAVFVVFVDLARAETRLYLIPTSDGRGEVVRTWSPDAVGEDKIVFVDCGQENNPDQIGCIIATNLVKEKGINAHRRHAKK